MYRLPGYMEPFREKLSPQFFELRKKLKYFIEAYIVPIEKKHHRWQEVMQKQNKNVFFLFICLLCFVEYGLFFLFL